MSGRAAAVDGAGEGRGAGAAPAGGERTARDLLRGLAGGRGLRYDGVANHPRGARRSDAEDRLKTADSVFRAASVL